MAEPRMQERVFTVIEVLRATEQWLQQRSVDAPRRSAELLLGHVLSLDRLQLYLAHDRPMSAPERAAMRALVARRGVHEPVAYLLGEWSFRELALQVGPAVLIPRPETEQLVDLALARLPQGGAVIDLGTGSGAIAIAIAHARPDAVVLATDVSKNALAVARQNAERNGAAVTFAHGSWWAACREPVQYDLVVSNPPYIDPLHPELVGKGVAEFEPTLALFTPKGDPTSCYRELVAGLDAHLRPGGRLVFETGVGAAEPALALLQSQPFLADAALLPDFAGLPRYLVAVHR
jgi:release factor glutamine methyltransferase